MRRARDPQDHRLADAQAPRLTVAVHADPVAAIGESRHGPFDATSRSGGPNLALVSTRPPPAEWHMMSLRGKPLEQEVTLPEGRVVAVRVGVAEDSFIPRRDLDTVV